MHDAKRNYPDISKIILFVPLLGLIINISSSLVFSQQSQGFEVTTKSVMFYDLTFQQIDSLGKQGFSIIVPVAQIAAQGPHLPIGVHLYCATEISSRAASIEDCLVGVLITLGDCSDFSSWPGYITIDAQTLISIFKHYCRSLQAQGFKRLIFLCIAGGNATNTLRLAAGEYFKEHPDADIVLVTLRHLLSPKMFKMIREKDADPIISMMLAIRPDLVHLSELKKVKIKGSMQTLREAYRFREGYRLSDFFPDAIHHINRGSTREIGEKIIKEASNSLQKFIKEQ